MGALERSKSSGESRVELEYGEGGVPWFLLLFYLAFLVFFTRYVLDFQLPDFLRQGPAVAESVEGAGAGK